MLGISRTNQNCIEINGQRETFASHERLRQDHYVHYTHQMSDEAAEAWARALIRLVPLVYGALVGGFYGNLPAGLLLGLVVSLALDYRMWHNSFSRPLLRRCAATGCPVVAAVVRGFARTIGALGVRVPSTLRQMHCQSW
jgi:hypothetical protein